MPQGQLVLEDCMCMSMHCGYQSSFYYMSAMIIFCFVISLLFGRSLGFSILMVILGVVFAVVFPLVVVL